MVPDAPTQAFTRLVKSVAFERKRVFQRKIFSAR
jgi:hypothetical protein